MTYMVLTQAAPPASWETASAINATSAPIHMASSTVSGALMTALRSREKNAACLDLPSPTNIPCPAICSDIKRNRLK